MLLNARVTYFPFYYSIFLLFTLNFHVVKSNESNVTSESCAVLYEQGVEAYLDNRYELCVKKFEDAIEKYRAYSKQLQNCRLTCRNEAELSEPLYSIDIEHLAFYEKIVKNTLCIVKCKQQYKDTFFKYNINRETANLFENRKPYEYLQICYFQERQMQKAASAAFTYLIANPNDTVMLSNLKHYSSLEGVDMKEIVNYEAKQYIYLYIHGADAYEKKEWNVVINNMEESLSNYLQSEEECRAQCEGPYDQGWLPDFVPMVANHFTFVLKCKQKCRNKLNSLNGEIHDDLLPSHYHYLQYAYFQIGKLKEACASVASYLLFYPDDETMTSNMHYYQKLPKARDEFFQPRSEAKIYMQRQIYERRILNFINKEFNQIHSNREEEENRVGVTEGQSSSIETDNKLA